MLFRPFLVLTGDRLCYPVLVVEIPAHRFTDPLFKTPRGFPSKLCPDLGGVNRISAVVSGSILDEGDEPGMRHHRRIRMQFIKNSANASDNFQIGLFAVASDVIALTHTPGLQHGAQGHAMVGHIQPVADVLPVTIDGQWFSIYGVDNHQRDQFFRELPWPVII